MNSRFVIFRAKREKIIVREFIDVKMSIFRLVILIINRNIIVFETRQLNTGIFLLLIDF